MDIPEICRSEAAALAYLEDARWGDEPRCAHCNAAAVYKMTDAETGERNKRALWRCRACSRQYTVRAGTIFESSPIPLFKWCWAFWAAGTFPEGVSVQQLADGLGISYRSARFVLERLEQAAVQPG